MCRSWISELIMIPKGNIFIDLNCKHLNQNPLIWQIKLKKQEHSIYNWKLHEVLENHFASLYKIKNERVKMRCELLWFKWVLHCMWLHATSLETCLSTFLEVSSLTRPSRFPCRRSSGQKQQLAAARLSCTHSAYRVTLSSWFGIHR